MLQAQGQIFDRHAINFAIGYSDNDKSADSAFKNAAHCDNVSR